MKTIITLATAASALFLCSCQCAKCPAGGSSCSGAACATKCEAGAKKCPAGCTKPCCAKKN